MYQHIISRKFIGSIDCCEYNLIPIDPIYWIQAKIVRFVESASVGVLLAALSNRKQYKIAEYFILIRQCPVVQVHYPQLPPLSVASTHIRFAIVALCLFSYTPYKERSERKKIQFLFRVTVPVKKNYPYFHFSEIEHRLRDMISNLTPKLFCNQCRRSHLYVQQVDKTM